MLFSFLETSLFFSFFILFFFFFLCLWEKFVIFLETPLFFSFFILFFFLSFSLFVVRVYLFFLSFCSECTSPLDLNYSGLFFLEIANKQGSNFLPTSIRELLIFQFDHKSEFQLKNLHAYVSQKIPVYVLDHKKNFCHELSQYIFTLRWVIVERERNFTSFSPPRQIKLLTLPPLQ